MGQVLCFLFVSFPRARPVLLVSLCVCGPLIWICRDCEK